MPARNRIKSYGKDCFYHIYNRGYNRQTVFHDGQDYGTFLYLFKKYLEPGFKQRKFLPNGEEYFVEPDHVYLELDLLAYCLMPNHFHLLVFQKTIGGMTKLMRRVATSYSNFFNQKYQKEGSPFQDIYKAVRITTEEQLVHTSRYIHINPIEIIGSDELKVYPYSSYSYYLSLKKPVWLKTEKVLSSFGSIHSYKNFVDEFIKSDEEIRQKNLDPWRTLLLD